MRPIKLTMEAFGPYIDKTEIDFSLFGESDLFLITGETGSGKSMIFDAISYALYGEGSIGEKRDAENMRCESVDFRTPTVVTLKVELNGRIYEIERKRTLKAEKQDREVAPKDSLTCLLLPERTDVLASANTYNRKTEKLKALIGIPKDIFSMLILLPQNKFAEFIETDAKKRGPILEKIFNVDIYSRLMETAKKRAEDSMRCIRERLAEIAVEKKKFVMTGNSETDELLNTVMTEKDSDIPSLLEKQNSILEPSSKAWKEENERWTALTREKENAIRLSNEIKSSMDARAVYKNAESRFISSNERFDELKKAEEEAKAASESIPDLREEITRREIEKSRISTLLQDQRKYGALRARVDEISSMMPLFDERKAQRERSMILLLEDLRKAEEDIAGKDSLNEDIRKITAYQEKLKNISRLNAEYMSLLSEADALRNLVMECNNETSFAEAECARIRALWISSTAGILLSELRPGAPCPLCGSLEHPRPAALPEKSATAEDERRSRKAAEDARIRLAEATTGLTGKLAEAERKQMELSEAWNECFSDNSVYDGERLKNEWLFADDEMSKKRSLFFRIRSQETLRQELIMKKEALESENLSDTVAREGLLAERNSDIAQLEELSSTIAKLSEGIVIRDFNTIDSEIFELNSRIRNLTESEREATSSFNALVNERNRLIGVMSAKKEEADKVFTVTKEETDERINELSEEIDETLRKREAAHNIYESNFSVLTSIAVSWKNAEEMRRANRELLRINDAISGGRGEKKMSLKRWVLTSFLDKVIWHANKRFTKMTDDQYEMKRESVTEANEDDALGITVLDHHWGTERPISSLSGGETFLASLSLALGMADTVEEENGGIRIDTVFIDEGFGSLSPDKLEKAISALYSLSSSGQLVGFVSHVEELKSRIGKQIRVTKTREKGSSVTMRF